MGIWIYQFKIKINVLYYYLNTLENDSNSNLKIAKILKKNIIMFVNIQNML